MLVKYQGLQASLKRKIYPVYFIIGPDQYLQNDIAYNIKQAWKSSGSVDEEIIDVNDDWQNVFDLACSYSLFSELILLDVRYAKKTISANFKEHINKYLENYNNKSLVIIRAPEISFKQLDFLTNQIQICSAQPLSLHELEAWIKSQLRSINIITDDNIPKLIAQYSQNNMLAAHQTIIKLDMMCYDKKLTDDILLEFINDQSDYPVYELTSACLQANITKAITILRKFSKNNQNTSVYILWLLSLEIQNLIQLKEAQINQKSMQNAYKKLKIWPQKIKMYENALRRFNLNKLEIILNHCAQLDFKLKSSTDVNVWDKLEQLVLLISSGWSNNDKILVNEI